MHTGPGLSLEELWTTRMLNSSGPGSSETKGGSTGHVKKVKQQGVTPCYYIQEFWSKLTRTPDSLNNANMVCAYTHTYMCMCVFISVCVDCRFISMERLSINRRNQPKEVLRPVDHKIVSWCEMKKTKNLSVTDFFSFVDLVEYSYLSSYKRKQLLDSEWLPVTALISGSLHLHYYNVSHIHTISRCGLTLECNPFVRRRSVQYSCPHYSCGQCLRHPQRFSDVGEGFMGKI